MVKWRGYNNDKVDAPLKDKIRRRKQHKKPKEASDLFEKPESEWLYDKGYKTFRARVVEVHKKYAFVSPEKEHKDIATKDVWLATTARKYLTSKKQERNLIAVGDIVLCREADDNEGQVESELPYCVIENMAPRTSKIARVDPITVDRQHVLAANIDQLIIVTSFLDPKIKWGLLDRYLVLAEEQQIPAVIILNKKDLLEQKGSAAFQEECQEQIKLYKDLGYPVYIVSALTRKGLGDQGYDEILGLFKDKVSILSGHSGVGKSSLINLFDPEITQEVEPNSDIFYKGRHTTTYASMIRLGVGGYVVDTPGIRSFLLAERGSISLTHCFIEFRPLLGACKYRECSHINEPECAVKGALEKGEISERRYKSYVGLLTGQTGREGRVREDYE